MKNVFKIVMILFVLISSLALFGICLAEEYTAREKVKKEEKKKAIKLKEVVVTATRTEKDVDSAPGNVTVISKEDMKFTDYNGFGGDCFFETFV